MLMLIFSHFELINLHLKSLIARPHDAGLLMTSSLRQGCIVATECVLASEAIEPFNLDSAVDARGYVGPIRSLVMIS